LKIYSKKLQNIKILVNMFAARARYSAGTVRLSGHTVTYK